MCPSSISTRDLFLCVVRSTVLACWNKTRSSCLCLDFYRTDLNKTPKWRRIQFWTGQDLFKTFRTESAQSVGHRIRSSFSLPSPFWSRQPSIVNYRLLRKRHSSLWFVYIIKTQLKYLIDHTAPFFWMKRRYRTDAVSSNRGLVPSRPSSLTPPLLVKTQRFALQIRNNKRALLFQIGDVGLRDIRNDTELSKRMRHAFSFAGDRRWNHLWSRMIWLHRFWFRARNRLYIRPIDQNAVGPVDCPIGW